MEKLPTACATALLQVLQAKSTGGHARGWSRSRSSERALYHFWPRATSDEGHGVVFGSCDVHTCGPGASPGCLVEMGMLTKFGSSRALCPRLASSATQSRAWPSSSRLLRSRLRRSNTSCPAGSCCLHPSAGCSAPACSSPRAAPASVPAPAPHPQQPPEAVPLSWA